MYSSQIDLPIRLVASYQEGNYSVLVTGFETLIKYQISSPLREKNRASSIQMKISKIIKISLPTFVKLYIVIIVLLFFFHILSEVYM
jgi:hypothetical protein